VFNVREGVASSSFAIPKRVLGDPPFEKGPAAGRTIDVISMAKSYYRAMDWDYATGRPSKQKLETLGLKDIAEGL
jgi:aldehyde:ferredoxin oxidoreductase